MYKQFIKNRCKKAFSKIKYGQITLTTPDGEVITVTGANPGYHANVILHNWQVVLNIKLMGQVGFATDYRSGKVETNDLLSLLNFLLQNNDLYRSYNYGNSLFKFISNIVLFTKRNTLKRSKKNIEFHYDLGNKFYQQWLDSSMTYSSALFKLKDESLTSAQYNKYDRLLDRISQTPATILEIGCGWGGFAELAVARGHIVKGITLSPQQASYAQQRLQHTTAQIAVEDYRQQQGAYDYIVSIEMLEAVGKEYWYTYFKTLKKLLKANGKILLQTIIIKDEYFAQYAKNTDIMRSYIFPGGMLPSLAEITKVLQSVDLECNEIFEFGDSYSQTLTQWLQQFIIKKQEIKNLGFKDNFIRLWECYLCGCIAGFNSKGINVVQLEISHITRMR